MMIEFKLKGAPRLDSLFNREIAVVVNKATAATINDLLFAAKKSAASTLTTWFPNMRPRFKNFLGRGILVDKATSDSLLGVVGFRSELTRQIAFEEGAGVRKPKGRKIAVPVAAKSRSIRSPKAVLRRKNTFAAKIKGVDGIWLREKSGKLVLLYVLKNQTIHRVKKSRFERLVDNSSRRRYRRLFEQNFDRSLTKKLKSLK